MIKKPFFWLLFVLFVFFISLQIVGFMQPKVLWVSDIIQNAFWYSKEGISNFFTVHFNQARTIERLSNEVRKEQELELKLANLQANYDSLLHSLSSFLPVQTSLSDTNETVNNIFGDIEPKFYPARANSYVALADSKKLWLNVSSNILENYSKMGNYRKIFGLVYNNSVAGIAVYENGRLVAYLNGEEHCNYSVRIGETGATGIVKYDIDGTFIVDYIPSYFQIQKGDLITTSGLDGIFFAGIQVGTIDEIQYRQGYKVAKISPFSKEPELYYWLVDIPNAPIPQDNDIEE